MKTNPTCRVCDVILDSENWYISNQRARNYVCNECENERHRLWRKANPEKAKATSTRGSRKNGKRPFYENKECALFLGVHVAERVLSHVFKDVERMPMNNPGYDFICNRGKKIDSKSSCIHKDKCCGSVSWSFVINHNTTADFFLCLAFDNREDLTPLHAWLIPRSKVNHLAGLSISEGMIHKWNVYRLDLSKISTCCDSMR